MFSGDFDVGDGCIFFYRIQWRLHNAMVVGIVIVCVWIIIGFDDITGFKKPCHLPSDIEACLLFVPFGTIGVAGNKNL